MKTNLKLFQARMFCAATLEIGAFFSSAAAAQNLADTAPGKTLEKVASSQASEKLRAFSDANWISMNPSIPGANNPVSAAVVDESGNLYIGGIFTLVGDVLANGIAKWDGSRWSALGAGLRGGVLALAVSGSDVYVGGTFPKDLGNPGNYIAKWDGRSWSVLGAEVNGWVSALAVSGGDVYAAGDFTMAGGRPANNVAKWNGTSWSPLGSGIDRVSGTPVVFSLAASGGDVYAGGNFKTAGGITVNGIAKWNGSGWSALGSGMGGVGFPYVLELAVSASDVYAGGNFTTAGGIEANHIAKWNGNSWSGLESGLTGGDPSFVSSLAASGSEVYAGGTFTTAGGISVNGMAKWNGSGWSALGSAMGSYYTGPNGLAVSGSDVYAVGGLFTTPGGSAFNSIAKWDGTSWSALASSSGVGGAVYAFAVLGSDLYVGGEFRTAAGIMVNGIAQWNGRTWSALGTGIRGDNGSVSALAVSSSDVYVGGGFTTAGSTDANYVAKWNGSSWTALGTGMNGYVRALAVSGSDLYAGGYFTTAGGTAANHIAKWDGKSWSALGSGMTGPPGPFGSFPSVFALAVSGNDVYAAGAFTAAGGSAATNIAKWNGSSWMALGSSLDGSPDPDPAFGRPLVSALAVSGSDLYAGGFFTTTGENEVYNIARWDGKTWAALPHALGSVRGPVNALVVSGSDLYVGSNNSIAKWDGNNWMALGSGVDGSVYALAVSGTDLYAGGIFTTAGGKVSPYLARAYLPALPALSVLRLGTDIGISWRSADTAGFALEQAGTIAAPSSWVITTASVSDNGINKSVTLSATNSPQFFRLRRP